MSLDRNKIKQQIEFISKDPSVIKYRKIISYDDYLWLRELSKNYKLGDFNKLFKPVPKKHKSLFIVKTNCRVCKDYIELRFSKQGFLDNVRYGDDNLKYSLCIKCEEKREKIKRIRYNMKMESNKIKSEENLHKNTKYYIDNYLNPDRSWVKEIKYSKKFIYINNDFYSTNHDEIINHIKSMDYYDFLKTPYWDAVRSKVLMKYDFKCMLCSAKGKLSVHHNTYENHGSEHLNLNDLICICSNCHESHHKLENERSKNA